MLAMMVSLASRPDVMGGLTIGTPLRLMGRIAAGATAISVATLALYPL